MFGNLKRRNNDFALNCENKLLLSMFFSVYGTHANQETSQRRRSRKLRISARTRPGGIREAIESARSPLGGHGGVLDPKLRSLNFSDPPTPQSLPELRRTCPLAARWLRQTSLLALKLYIFPKKSVQKETELLV